MIKEGKTILNNRNFDMGNLVKMSSRCCTYQIFRKMAWLEIGIGIGIGVQVLDLGNLFYSRSVHFN